MTRSIRLVCVLTLVCFSFALVTGSAVGQQPEKIRITKLDDLPQHTYAVSGKVADLVKSDKLIAELAAQVRANVESDLAKYEIDDSSTLQRMHGTLLVIEMIGHDYDAALKRIEKIRALEDKQAKKLTTGLSTRAMIAARREVGEHGGMGQYKQAFRRHLSAAAEKLPWDIVQDVIQENKGRMEIFSENLLMGIVQAQMEPVAAKTGELSADMAGSVLGIHFMIKERLPLKGEVIAVYQGLIDAHKEVKPDIWAARDVTLDKSRNLEPVLVAIWDSGTDAALFKDRLFVNPNEKLDGQDNDDNGFIDDIHGPAYDIHAQRTTGALCPLGGAAERMPKIMKHIKGFMDLQAAVDSPEATAVKQFLAGLGPADVKGFLEDMGLAGGYSHGTHVAGIVAAGNPFARLLIARHSYDYHIPPVTRTIEWGRRDGDKCRDTVEYLKQHDVRLVNMSWGEAQKDAEDSLEQNGIGNSAEQRREIARKVFAEQRKGLFEAIKNAPEILFVCAAGNADNDVEFDEYIPSSFDLPNLLVIGAVDQAGDPTTFTSFGRTVEVCANGFEVDSYIPGGERMKMSGTSMASPHAANLAAKLLALDPKLTPPQVIDLIKRGADRKTVGENSFLLLNPSRSVELLQTRVKTKAGARDS